jgi:hypothetical protein
MAASGGGNGEIAEVRAWWGEWGARGGNAEGAWRRDYGVGGRGGRLVGLDVGEGDGGVG